MNKQIAVIGFNPIYSIGLKEVLLDIGRYTVTCFSDFTDFSQQQDQFSNYIITQDVFNSYLDYFLPRKSKIIVAFQNIKTSSIELFASFNMNDESEKVKKTISSVIKAINTETNEHELSTREIEVLKEIAKGKLNKEIADTLNISVNTVITHRKNLTAKLGIRSASGLSLYAMMNGLI